MSSPKSFKVDRPTAPSRHTIVIDPEFESLIPAIGAAERTQLETSLRDAGGILRDRLVVWDSPDGWVLLDGHNRVDILFKMDPDGDPESPGIMESDVQVLSRTAIPDRAAALLWIETNQVSRRNLTDDQRAMIWQSIKTRRVAAANKAKAEAARAAVKDRNPVASNAKSDSGVKTAPKSKERIREAVAKESNLPASKLRTAEFVVKASPGLAADVRSGKKTLRNAKKEAQAITFKPALLDAEGLSSRGIQEAQNKSNENLKHINDASNIFFTRVDPAIIKIKAAFTEKERTSLLDLRIGFQATINHITKLLTLSKDAA
jgi:hypothetical protein